MGLNLRFRKQSPGCCVVKEREQGQGWKGWLGRMLALGLREQVESGGHEDVFGRESWPDWLTWPVVQSGTTKEQQCQ